MPGQRQSFECVYTSGVWVEDAELLGALCIFYDKVGLPHPYDLDPEASPLIRWPYDKLRDLETEQRRYTAWVGAHRELFDAGILEVLPPPLTPGADEPEDLAERLRGELGTQMPYFTSSQVLSGRLAVAMQALFANTAAPEFLMHRPGDTSTEHLRTILATSLLRYRLPTLGALAPERILELREEARPYKDGFIAYISSMVDDVEGRLTATHYDERAAAMRTIERRINPDLEEFLRRETAEKVEWWAHLTKSVASSAKTFLKVVFTPWNVLNYPDILSGPADTVETIAEEVSRRASNRHLALQLVGTLEREAA